MRLTKETLAQGASDSGGFSRKQTDLLGVSWPRVRGWQKALMGSEVPDEVFAEFVWLAKRLSTAASPLNSALHEPVAVDQGDRPAANSRVLYIYALALADGFFYVGMTDNFERRFRQHCAGIASDWTTLHRPVRRLHCVCTGTSDRSQAARMEDEVTLELMLQHGADKVRGGQYIFASQELVDSALRSHGHWHRFKRRDLDRQAFESQASWGEALDDFLKVALAYYEAGAPTDQRDAVFTACYRLTRYRYWREEFAPGLSWHFWNTKGILPVLLTFKHGRVIGSRSNCPYEVLAATLQRGRRNEPTLRRLFLLAWQGHRPPATPKQDQTIRGLRDKHLVPGAVFDNRYDEFVSVLLPSLRHLLRR
jgi:predicted GIY-YIG superfamily endonuclease